MNVTIHSINIPITRMISISDPYTNVSFEVPECSIEKVQIAVIRQDDGRMDVLDPAQIEDLLDANRFCSCGECPSCLIKQERIRMTLENPIYYSPLLKSAI